MKWLYSENLLGSHLIWHRNRKCVIRQIAEADSILCEVAFSCHIVQYRAKKRHYRRTMRAIRWSQRYKRIVLTISGTGIWVGSLREQVPVTFLPPFFTCVCSRFDMSSVAFSFRYAGAVKATSLLTGIRSTPVSDVTLHLNNWVAAYRRSGARFLVLRILMQDLLALPQFWWVGWLHQDEYRFYPEGGNRWFLRNVGKLIYLATRRHIQETRNFKTNIEWQEKGLITSSNKNN